MGRLARLRRRYGLFDARFYQLHNGLPRVYRGLLGYTHFRLWGEARGFDPNPLFSSAFVQRQRALENKPPLDRPFTQYVDDPELWAGLDPHPAVFSRGDPFAARGPAVCPLERLAAEGFEWTDGDHPVVPLSDRIRPTGAPVGRWLDGSVGAGLQGLAERMGRAVAEDAPISVEPFDVIMLAGDHHCPACAQYRVHNAAHALREAGMRVTVLYADDLSRVEAFDLAARVVVVSRPVWRPELTAFLADQRAKGARIGFECDDVLFDLPHAVGIQFDEQGRLSTRNVNLHAELCGAVLLETDFGVFPTSLLGAVARERHRALASVYVVPSFLSDSQLAAAARVGRPPEDDSRVVVAYSSGTWTHSADFASIAASLASVLEQRPQVTLRVNGSLKVEDYPELRRFLVEGRIVHDHRILRDWGDHIARLAGADVNVVPLEMDNGFCHAKSEVRYLESGCVGVPTLASPTEAYQRAIDHGVNGMLAANGNEWITALLAMVDDPVRRRAMGRAAQDDVNNRYSVRGPYSRALSAALRTEIRGGGEVPATPTSPPADHGVSRVDGLLVPGVGGAGEWLDGDGSSRVARTVDEARRVAPDPREIMVLRTEVEMVVARHEGLFDRDVRIAALGPELHARARQHHPAVLLGMPGHDPAIFFGRQTGSPTGAVLVDVPPGVALVDFGDTPQESLRTLSVRVARAYAVDEVILICPGRSSGLPAGVRAVEGFASSLELATLLRQSPALVVLDANAMTPAVGAAILTGTPVAKATPTDASIEVEDLAWASAPGLAEDLRRVSVRAFGGALGM